MRAVTVDGTRIMKRTIEESGCSHRANSSCSGALNRRAFVAIGKKAGMDDLQIVIFCEAEHEVISQRLDFPQGFVDDNRSYAVQHAWANKW